MNVSTRCAARDSDDVSNRQFTANEVEGGKTGQGRNCAALAVKTWTVAAKRRMLDRE